MRTLPALLFLAALLAAVAASRRSRRRAARRAGADRLHRSLPDGLHDLTVVVPAFREPGIEQTVARLRAELTDELPERLVEIVVVDDGSPDDTAARAVRAGADKVLRLPENRGKGAAVRAGMLAARGRVVAFTDADLSYSPDQVATLLPLIESGWDVVVGSRECAGAGAVGTGSSLRRIGHRLVGWSTRTVLTGRHTDTQCGLKAFRADVARDVFSRARIDRFAFDVEILHIVERLGHLLTEAPVTVVHSDRSTVRVGRDAVRLYRDLARIWWWSRGGAYDAGARRRAPGPAAETVSVLAPSFSPVPAGGAVPLLRPMPGGRAPERRQCSSVVRTEDLEPKVSAN